MAVDEEEAIDGVEDIQVDVFDDGDDDVHRQIIEGPTVKLVCNSMCLCRRFPLIAKAGKAGPSTRGFEEGGSCTTEKGSSYGHEGGSYR